METVSMGKVLVRATVENAGDLYMVQCGLKQPKDPASIDVEEAHSWILALHVVHAKATDRDSDSSHSPLQQSTTTQVWPNSRFTGRCDCRYWTVFAPVMSWSCQTIARC